MLGGEIVALGPVLVEVVELPASCIELRQLLCRDGRPERLPLDLQAELHLRADKLSIAYRRYLNELGLSFGTS